MRCFWNVSVSLMAETFCECLQDETGVQEVCSKDSWVKKMMGVNRHSSGSSRRRGDDNNPAVPFSPLLQFAHKLISTVGL